MQTRTWRFVEKHTTTSYVQMTKSKEHLSCLVRHRRQSRIYRRGILPLGVIGSWFGLGSCVANEISFDTKERWTSQRVPANASIHLRLVLWELVSKSWRNSHIRFFKAHSTHLREIQIFWWWANLKLWTNSQTPMFWSEIQRNSHVLWAKQWNVLVLIVGSATVPSSWALGCRQNAWAWTPSRRGQKRPRQYGWAGGAHTACLPSSPARKIYISSKFSSTSFVGKAAVIPKQPTWNGIIWNSI